MNDMIGGVDLAKNVFQLHGASMTGDVKYRKKLSRGQFFRFMSEQSPALVVMEEPRMLVAIALANKMARTIWAMLTKQEDYRDPALAMAA